MSTFLQLCQDVARESGTVPNIGEPSTTTDQSGRLLRIINWTASAYADIQRHKNYWRWLHADFSGETISGTREYSASAMSVSTRFSRWIFHGEQGDNLFTTYKASEGQDTEGFLTFVDWANFRRKFAIGSAVSDTGKPAYVTVNDQNELVFYPTPDAGYTVRGVYYKSPQTLSADDDVPEMPEDFHIAIQWRALMLLGAYDEAPNQVPNWTAEYFKVMQDLRSHQLPRIRQAGALA